MSFLGDFFKPVMGAIGSAFGQHSANKQMQANRDYQERMSNTSHQREVKDLRAAGLNPMLSINKGASTPTGGAVPYQNPMQNFTKDYVSSKQVNLNKKNIEADIAVKMENAKNLATSRQLTNAQILKTMKETDNLPTMREKILSDILLNSAREKDVSASGRMKRQNININSGIEKNRLLYGDAQDRADFASRLASSKTGAIGGSLGFLSKYVDKKSIKQLQTGANSGVNELYKIIDSMANGYVAMDVPRKYSKFKKYLNKWHR